MVLQKEWSNAHLRSDGGKEKQMIKNIFWGKCQEVNAVNLHLKGTPFQVKVWEALLKVPFGQLVSYGDISEKIDMPNANRAVGTAIGRNPVAFLIPCHRVVRKAGEIGDYKWGCSRKSAIIGWESAMAS